MLQAGVLLIIPSPIIAKFRLDLQLLTRNRSFTGSAEWQARHHIHRIPLDSTTIAESFPTT